MNDDLNEQLDNIENGKKTLKKRNKSFNLVDLLTVLVLFIIAFMILVVVLAIVYPQAAKNIAKTVLSPSGNFGKAVAQIADRATDGFNYRVQPMVSDFREAFEDKTGKKKSGEEAVAKKAVAKKPLAKIDTKACIECHPDLFQKKASNHIYTNHQTHEALQIECGVCHINDKHPRPGIVEEKTCIDCHIDNQASTDCKTCHTPGSILDDRLISQAKTAEFLGATVADKKVLVPEGFEHPVDYNNQPCNQCHEVPEFCFGCHISAGGSGVQSPHDNRFISSHGSDILNRRGLTIVGCKDCHNTLLCAAACHINPDRQRMSPKWPLPRLELE